MQFQEKDFWGCFLIFLEKGLRVGKKVVSLQDEKR